MATYPIVRDGKGLNKYFPNTENIFIPFDDAIEGDPSTLTKAVGYYKGVPFDFPLAVPGDAAQWNDKYYRLPSGNSQYLAQINRSTETDIFDNVLDFTDSFVITAFEFKMQNAGNTGATNRLMALDKDFTPGNGGTRQMFEYRIQTNQGINPYFYDNILGQNGGHTGNLTAADEPNIAIIMYDFRPGSRLKSYAYQYRAGEIVMLRRSIVADLAPITIQSMVEANVDDIYFSLGARLDTTATPISFVNNYDIRNLRIINFGSNDVNGTEFVREFAANRLNGMADFSL